MKNYRARKMVTVAMLASISFVIMFFAFPVVPLFPFMKVDFSEIPILIGAYLLGPGAAGCNCRTTFDFAPFSNWKRLITSRR